MKQNVIHAIKFRPRQYVIPVYPPPDSGYCVGSYVSGDYVSKYYTGCPPLPPPETPPNTTPYTLEYVASAHISRYYVD